MGEVIEVDFQRRQKVEKYTVSKYLCGNCLNNFYRDTRKAENDKFILFECGGGHGLCAECANKVKEALDGEGW